MERRVASLERLAGKTYDLVHRAEAAVQAASSAITASEAAHLWVRSIEVVNNRGKSMVSIRANDVGGSVLLRNGAGEEIAAIGYDENGQGVVVVKDPAGLATAALQIRDGRGEMLTMSTQGGTCAVGPGRPTKNA